MESLALTSSRAALLHQALHAFLLDETGQDLIEYGLLATLLSLCAISLLQGLSMKIVALLTLVSSGLTSAI